MRVLFVVPSDGFLPSGTVRVRQYLPLLEGDGIQSRIVSYYSPVLDRFAAAARASAPGAGSRIRIMAAMLGQVVARWAARVKILWLAPQSDIVFIQGVLLPVWFINILRGLAPKLVLDLDDAIYLGNPARGAAVMSKMWQVVAGSHRIYEDARAATARVTLVPSPVEVDRYASLAAGDTTSDVVRIGWLGSESTVHYLRQLVAPLRQLIAEGHRIELLIDGVPHDGGVFAAVPELRVVFTARYFDADIPALVARYHIGVMPLDDGPWERAKCAMKALIYMAAARPAVVSAVGENTFVIEDGVNGRIVSDEAGWVEALRVLIADAAYRRELGARGRETVVERYDVRVCYAALREHVFGPAAARAGAGAAG